MPSSSELVDMLLWQLKCLAPHIPWPMREVQFSDGRRWAFDLCWPPHKVAVEIDGGIWRKGGGAHTGTGHIRDLRKGNAAVIAGYRVLHFIPEDIIDRHGHINDDALKEIVKVFKTLGVAPGGTNA